MDRIRILGGRRLNGTIPISGAKNATLPLMIASLLTDQTLTLDNVPRLADVALLQRILGNHGVDIMVGGKRAGETADDGQTLHISAAYYRRHHRALRSGVAHARKLLGAGAAGRAHGASAGVAARRLRHRHAPGRSSDHGDGAARRQDRHRRRLCGGERAARPQGRRDRIPQGYRRRHPHRDNGGVARQWHDRDRERGARAGDRRRRRLPQQDGRADFRRRHRADHRRRRRHAPRRAP